MKKQFKSLMLLVISFSLFACVQIDPGESGILFRKYGGGLEKDHIYTDGVEFIAPWNDMIIYNTKEQTRSYESEVLEKNGLPVTIVATVNYSVVPQTVGYLHSEIGTGYREIIIDTKARGAIKDVVGKYTAEELYSTKRGELEHGILEALEPALFDNYMMLSYIEIADVGLPQAIENGITAKEVQEQKNLLAQKKEQEQSYLANARVATAQGNYNAAVLEGKANREIANSITSSLIKWKQLEVQQSKWDGKYPLYMGGDAGMLLNLNN
jgi:prohibitin 1